jgi:hypothetical protein
MKLLFPAVVMALQLTVSVQQVLCQEFRVKGGFTMVEEKRPLRVETSQGRAIFLEASTIVSQPARKLKVGTGKWSSFDQLWNQNSNPSLFHLRGNVVIKMDCFLPLQGPVPVCTVLRADEAEYNEETGEIKAGKTVRVKLEPTLAQ